MIYYNDNEPSCVDRIHRRMKKNLLPKGEIDDRSIEDVTSGDLAGFTQCHFFAGGGGWAHALELARWSTDRPIWTASCPCQPFSIAGKGKGESDKRHLWPFLRNLVGECQPSICVGEQVASPAGRAWLKSVLDEMETMGYAGAGADLCAAGIGAPHIRQRLYWVGIADSYRQQTRSEAAETARYWNPIDATSRDDSRLAHARHGGRRSSATGETGRREKEGRSSEIGESGTVSGVGNTQGRERQSSSQSEQGKQTQRQNRRSSTGSGMDDTDCSMEERLRRIGFPMESKQEAGRPGYASAWSEVEFTGCADGKARPTKPGIYPLVNGFPGRMELLKEYGNAIVPQIAARFIEAIK